MNMIDIYELIVDEWQKAIPQLGCSTDSRASFLIAIAAARISEELEEEKRSAQERS